jgi:hypothetical protein
MLMIFKKVLLLRFGLCVPANWLFSVLMLAALSGLYSCTAEKEPDPETEKRQLLEGGLPGAHSLLLDSISSEISWSIRHSQGGFLSGRFRPVRGILLLEGNAVVAGFWEGDFFTDNVLSDSSRKAEGSTNLKFLRDSVPGLFRPGGSLLRMDLKQVSRVVPRSEFRGSSIQDSLLPSHDLAFQMLLADSSQSIRVPLRIHSEQNRLVFSGQYQLNLRDFGILSAQQPKPGSSYWIPEVKLEFSIKFYKNPTRGSSRKSAK